MVSQKNIHVLTLVNITLYAKKEKKFRCDYIKDLEIGSLSWIIQMFPKCHHMYTYKREAGETWHRIEKYM